MIEVAQIFTRARREVMRPKSVGLEERQNRELPTTHASVGAVHVQDHTPAGKLGGTAKTLFAMARRVARNLTISHSVVSSPTDNQK